MSTKEEMKILKDEVESLTKLLEKNKVRIKDLNQKNFRLEGELSVKTAEVEKLKNKLKFSVMLNGQISTFSEMQKKHIESMKKTKKWSSRLDEYKFQRRHSSVSMVSLKRREEERDLGGYKFSSSVPQEGESRKSKLKNFLKKRRVRGLSRRNSCWVLKEHHSDLKE